MAMEVKRSFKNLFENPGIVAFLWACVGFLLIGIWVLASTKHGDVVLFVNRYSKEEFDRLVGVITDLGSGVFAASLMVALLFWKVRAGLTGLISLGFVGIFTNVLKRQVFSERIRPFNYFYYDDFQRFIYTAELNYHFSFPSGHTMTIFSVMSVLAIMFGRRTVGILFFLIALVVGFSRIYLLQHFFLDVYVGSFFGVISTFLAVLVLNGLLRLQRFSWFDKPAYLIKFK